MIRTREQERKQPDIDELRDKLAEERFDQAVRLLAWVTRMSIPDDSIQTQTALAQQLRELLGCLEFFSISIGTVHSPLPASNRVQFEIMLIVFGDKLYLDSNSSGSGKMYARKMTVEFDIAS